MSDTSEATSLRNDFKEAMASWASGVCVAATKAGELVYGVTVSSLSSLSLDPPLILICLARSNRLTGMIEASGMFSLSILADDQAEISAHFAKHGRDPEPDFGPVAMDWTSGGMPVIRGAAAHLVCTLHAVVPEGDHFIIIGRAQEAGAQGQRRPLLYFRRGYRAIDTGAF